MIGSEIIRPLTSRLPKPLLLELCRIAKPLYHVHRLPVVGLATSALLPTSLNPEPEWRWLDTFDWVLSEVPVQAHQRRSGRLVPRRWPDRFLDPPVGAGFDEWETAELG